MLFCHVCNRSLYIISVKDKGLALLLLVKGPFVWIGPYIIRFLCYPLLSTEGVVLCQLCLKDILAYLYCTPIKKLYSYAPTRCIDC